MIALENIAGKLNLQSNELIYKSIKAFLNEQLNSVEIEIFKISKTHGVNDLYDFLEKIKNGEISETIGYDDFFLLDNLTAQRDNIMNILNEIL